MSFYEQLKFNADGLIPAIIQEQKTGRVVMMAWMNRASLEKTIETLPAEVLDEGRIQRPRAGGEGHRL